MKRKVLLFLMSWCLIFLFSCKKEVINSIEEIDIQKDTSLVTPINNPEPLKPEGRLKGVFSVSATSKVCFSKGNLQYNASLGTHACADGTNQKGTWRFAERQYDYVGDASKGNVYCGEDKCNNTNIDENYNGWIDLFGWGTSGYDGRAPYTHTNTTNDYWVEDKSEISGTNYDWGYYNAISNGGNTPAIWRTLTANEGVYLFETRDAATTRYGYAKVDGVCGLLILPDEWSLPEGVEFLSYADGYTGWDANNIYSGEEFQKMEEEGAVFLPMTLTRAGTSVATSSIGAYWYGTATNNNGFAYRLAFESYNFYSKYSTMPLVFQGVSIRLVHDVE